MLFWSTQCLATFSFIIIFFFQPTESRVCCGGNAFRTNGSGTGANVCHRSAQRAQNIWVWANEWWWWFQIICDDTINSFFVSDNWLEENGFQVNFILFFIFWWMCKKFDYKMMIMRALDRSICVTHVDGLRTSRWCPIEEFACQRQSDVRELYSGK